MITEGHASADGNCLSSAACPSDTIKHSRYGLLFSDFSLPLVLLPKAKRSVGFKESGLEQIIVDMLGPKIKLR